jgi:hypothetical protein
VLALLLMLLVAVCALAQIRGAHRDVRLKLPKIPATLRSQTVILVAYIQAGPLPAGAHIDVYTQTGKLAGSITPYGAQERSHSITYTVPLPHSAVVAHAVQLQLQEVCKDKTVRAPARRELGSICLGYIPVTRHK